MTHTEKLIDKIRDIAERQLDGADRVLVKGFCDVMRSQNETIHLQKGVIDGWIKSAKSWRLLYENSERELDSLQQQPGLRFEAAADGEWRDVDQEEC